MYDKQGTAMNTISQWTANKLRPETLTISGRLAMVFLKIAQHTVCVVTSRDHVYIIVLILPSQQYEAQPLTCAFIGIVDAAVMDGDALLAQLLGMGFAIEEIERCQVAMATSSRPFSLQEATEW